MFNDVAFLGGEVKSDTVDKYGNRVRVFEWRQVFVKKQSVRQSEFYQAAQAGLKPTLVLVLAYSEEYQGEELVMYRNEKYNIIRTFETGGHLEMTLTRRIGTDE